MTDCEHIVEMLKRAGIKFTLQQGVDGGSYIDLPPQSFPVAIEFAPSGELESMTIMAT